VVDTSPRWDEPTPPGDYVTTAWVPADVLNEGLVSVEARMHSMAAPRLHGHAVAGRARVPRPGSRRGRLGARAVHRSVEGRRPAAARLDRGGAVTRLFVLYRDSPLRRAAPAVEAGSGERYSLFGADELAARGFDVRHSLEPGCAPRAHHRRADRVLRRAVRTAGGYDGDFASVLASRHAVAEADVVL
jgi:hypothetical protein